MKPPDESGFPRHSNTLEDHVLSSPNTWHSATPQSRPSCRSTVNTAERTFSLTLSSCEYQCMMPRFRSSGMLVFFISVQIGSMKSTRSRASSSVLSSSRSPYLLRSYKSAVSGMYSFSSVGSGGRTEKLSSPMTSPRPLPLSQRTWKVPRSSMWSSVPMVPGSTG